MKVSKKVLGTLVLGAALLAGPTFSHNHDAAAAGKTYLGVDWAVYQGNNGVSTANDEFAISQIGGYQGGIYTQSTYASQVTSARNKGLRAHTYIWYQVGASTAEAKQCLDYFLPKIKTPKGSIVALDYESGATGNKANNTAAIMYGMQRIKAAGYTPLLYSGKYYMEQNIDTAKVLKSYPNSLWVASYPTSSVAATPNFNYFPSMDGVAIWQFTDYHIAGGLDGNVDLLGVTFNGYSTSSTTTPTSNQLVQTSYKAVGSVAAGAKSYTYSNSKMVAGPSVSAGNWKTLTKGVINGSTYYSVTKDGKTTYAWVPASSIKFGVTSSNVMTQSSYGAVGTVSASAKLYYYTSKGMTAGPASVSGNWKTMTKGVINGSTYYLLSKDGKSGYAWVPASGIKFGVTSSSTNSTKMTQSSYGAVGTVSASAKLYYYTSKGMIAGPASVSGNWKTMTKGVINGSTYYLLSKDGKSGYAWVPASGIKFGVTSSSSSSTKMTQSSYGAKGIVSSVAKLYYYTDKGLIAGPASVSGTWKTTKKGVINGSTYYLLSKDGKSGYAWVPESGIRFGLK